MADGISSSNLEIHGNSGIILRDPGVIKINRTGMATCTAIFSIKKASYAQLKGINTAHPIFTFLSLDNYEIALEGAWAVQTANYAGVQAQYDDQSPTYELIVGLSEEPIETHPNFSATIGGTAIAPKNGAIFEKVESGTTTTVYKGGPTTPSNKGFHFKEFAVNYSVAGDTGATTTLNQYAKIAHYLEASQITWRRTTARRTSTANIANSGKIGTPKGPAPALPSGRNWLDMGLTQTQKGSVYQVVEEWRASGRRGWIATIYGPTS